MPKLKTKSGAKKRFKITGTGKVVYAQKGKRHGMIKRTNKQIRNLRGTNVLFKTDGDNVKKYLPAERLSRHFPSRFLDFVQFRRSVMARVKRGVTSHAKHKKTLKAAKGFYGRRKNTIRAAKAAVDRSMQYATRDRKAGSATFRASVDPAPQRRGARIRPDLFALHRRARTRPASRSTARFCRTSRSASRRLSRRSSRRPRPRCRPPWRNPRNRREFASPPRPAAGFFVFLATPRPASRYFSPRLHIPRKRSSCMKKRERDAFSPKGRRSMPTS